MTQLPVHHRTSVPARSEGWISRARREPTRHAKDKHRRVHVVASLAACLIPCCIQQLVLLAGVVGYFSWPNGSSAFESAGAKNIQRHVHALLLLTGRSQNPLGS